MGYHVEFVEPVLDYLALVPRLTDKDRVAIVAGIIDELSDRADQFFALRPLAHESLCFRYDFPYLTQEAGFNFDFVVDACNMAMGVVRVVYVEHTVEPIPPSATN